MGHTQIIGFCNDDDDDANSCPDLSPRRGSKYDDDEEEEEDASTVNDEDHNDDLFVENDCNDDLVISQLLLNESTEATPYKFHPSELQECIVVSLNLESFNALSNEKSNAYSGKNTYVTRNTRHVASYVG